MPDVVLSLREPAAEYLKHACVFGNMTHTLEISDELKEKLDSHVEEDETYEEFIAELISMYEAEGTLLQEGYSE